MYKTGCKHKPNPPAVPGIGSTNWVCPWCTYEKLTGIPWIPKDERKSKDQK